MVRAGIFIGADPAGDLQKLSDAATDAKRMYVGSDSVRGS